MKRSFKSLVIAFFVAIMMAALVACSSPYKEVAGTYEMSSITGKVSGITITKDSYEYFRIILDEDGNGTVQSKGKGLGAVSYEAKGEYTYENGKIKMTTKNGSVSVTEEYDYADGVITYSMESVGVSLTVTFTKVTAEGAE